MTAVFVEEGPDQGAIWHFGEPFKEEKALEAGTAWADLSHYSVISVSGEDRLKMCQLAVAELDLGDEVLVNSIEIRRSGPSYTIDTVEALKATYPNDKIVLILGTDAHATIDQWHRSDELKKLVEVLVIDRPDFPGSPTLDIDALNISATQARAGDFDLLPPAVVTYIKERGLYASK